MQVERARITKEEKEFLIDEIEDEDHHELP